jgi:hypothetical protein
MLSERFIFEGVKGYRGGAFYPLKAECKARKDNAERK